MQFMFRNLVVIKIIIKRTIAVLIEKIQSVIFSALIQSKNPSCHIYSGAVIDRTSVLGNHVVLFKDVIVLNSTIGNFSFIQRKSMINNADIGKFCSIAMNVVIGPGQHPTEFVSSHPSFYSLSQPVAKTFVEGEHYQPFKRTIIGSDVWIGHNAILMDGIKVGNGSVIAAGAVVTKDVPEYAIVGGVPAKIIKYRFSKEIIKKIKKTNWWENDIGWYYCNAEKFLDYKEFLKNDFI